MHLAAPLKDSPGGEQSLCARCKASPGTVAGRNDILCSTCFLAYVRSKSIKRMDPFRVRNVSSTTSAPPLLLLPFSFGVSSVSLLHILSGQLASQRERVGRTGYELLVVWVDNSNVTGETEDGKHKREVFAELAKGFGGADSGLRFEVVGIEKVYEYKQRNTSSNSEGRDISLVTAALEEADVNDSSPSIDPTTSATSPNAATLRALLSSLPSLTSQHDILSILLSRLLIAIGLQNRCAAIIYSHSTTRLAEKALAETAKGRAFTVPWITNDGPIPVENHIYHLSDSSTNPPPTSLSILYPLRDVLRKELITYTTLAPGSPSLTTFLVPQLSALSAQDLLSSPLPSVNPKTTTIDALMAQYFATLEDAYPSIVANVVKTVGKIPVPKVEGSGERVWCSVCGFPREEWNEEDGDGEILEGLMMCGGCRRSMEGVGKEVLRSWPL
ncbi:hypothetical protein BDZ91DRAFT_843714 [Kalaharituber pfeilii]|nr:hypothetical protein BDZ91DRAFT_843714 [Kalaharituber pfeilii]